jgi:regulator of replication initiation timing
MKNNLYNKEHDEEDQIVKLGKNENKLQKRIKKLEDENKLLKKENNEMKTSHSWRITAPLRKIIGLIKK